MLHRDVSFDIVRDPEEQKLLTVTVKNPDPVARCRSCIRLEIFAKTYKWIVAKKNARVPKEKRS